jgi:integrase
MAKKPGKRINHEGAIYQRKDGRWTGQLTTPDGRKTVYADDPAGVREKLEAMKATLAKGLPLPDEKLTLGAYLKTWIASVSNVRPSSWDHYETIVRVHLVPSLLSRTPLVKLTKQQVLGFYRQKQQDGLSPTTVRLIHTVLGRALREAMEDHLVWENVCQHLPAPRPAEREMLYLSEEQAQHFLTSIRTHRSFALFALALSTEMRQGELLGLRWKDVILDGPKPSLQVRLQSVEVREQGNYHRELAPLKTTRSKRRINLGPSVVQTLKAHEARQKLEKRIAGDAWQNLGLVFRTQRAAWLDGKGSTSSSCSWPNGRDCPLSSAFTTCATRLPPSRWSVEKA